MTKKAAVKTALFAQTVDRSPYIFRSPVVTTLIPSVAKEVLYLS